MGLTLFYIVAAVLLLLRLGAQWWARGSRPQATIGGRVSVVLWFVLYLVLLAGAVFEIQRSGVVNPAPVLLILLSLGLRLAGLHALRGQYHEAIAIQDQHQLVDRAVFRYLRHPLHLALLGEMVGLAWLCGRLWTLPLVATTLGVLLHRNRQEEKLLCERLGPPYADYLKGPAWDLVDLVPGRRGEGAPR